MPNVKLVLLHIELEKDVQNIEELIASRAHTVDGVALATVVELSLGRMTVQVPGKSAQHFISTNDLMETSFK